VAHFNLALLLAYLHFPLSNGYLIVEVLDYSVLPCFLIRIYVFFVMPQADEKGQKQYDMVVLQERYQSL